MDFLAMLQEQFEKRGFFAVRGRENCYWVAENPILYIVCVDTAAEGQAARQAEFLALCKQFLPQLTQFACTKLVALFVAVEKSTTQESVDNVDNLVDAFSEPQFYPVFWRFSLESGKVWAPQGQPNRIFGIEKLLAAAARGEAPEVLPLHEAATQKPPLATAALFLICLAALAWMQLSGRESEIILRFGMTPAALTDGEWYRFFSCMFLHGGWVHLISNSIYLYYFGVRAEQLLGRARFLLLYLASGICGSLCSLLLGGGGLSIGASGAIYGLLGAMLLLTKKRGAIYTGMSYTTMLLLAISAICLGFFEPNVDNLAHIGGFFGGILIFGLFLRQKTLK